MKKVHCKRGKGGLIRWMWTWTRWEFSEEWEKLKHLLRKTENSDSVSQRERSIQEIWPLLCPETARLLQWGGQGGKCPARNVETESASTERPGKGLVNTIVVLTQWRHREITTLVRGGTRALTNIMKPDLSPLSLLLWGGRRSGRDWKLLYWSSNGNGCVTAAWYRVKIVQPTINNK